MREKLEDASQEVFDELGSGWSESIYHRALERELSERGIAFHSEGTIPVMYKGAPVGRRRPDLFLVEGNGDTTIVELKAGNSGGWAQLEQYVDLTEVSEDLGYIRGGAVVRFNDSVEIEFIELGPEPNPDDSLEINCIKELPNGVEVYIASDEENSVQVNYNSLTGDVDVEANALAEAENDTELQLFHERAEEFVEEAVDDGDVLAE